MKLIVGLGNPGSEYEKTRHNAGFMVLDRLARRLDADFGREKFKALYAEGRLPKDFEGPAADDGKLVLAKPQTFMNLSGESVVGFMGFYKIPHTDVLVVVDEVALGLGVLRVRSDGSAGGHNGLKDIQQRLGTSAYARLRVGVGGREAGAERPVQSLVGHVLGRFSQEEQQELDAALNRAAEACLVWAGSGTQACMNRFNPREGAGGGGKKKEKRDPDAKPQPGN